MVQTVGYIYHVRVVSLSLKRGHGAHFPRLLSLLWVPVRSVSQKGSKFESPAIPMRLITYSM